MNHRSIRLLQLSRES